MIKIILGNDLIFRNGWDLSRFVGVKIIVGLMRFIVDGMLMKWDPTTFLKGGKWAC